MLIRCIILVACLIFVLPLLAQNDVALAQGLARAKTEEFKAASAIYDAAAAVCRKAKDKDGRNLFNDLKKKSETLDKCRIAVRRTENAIEKDDYKTALEQVKRARRFAKTSAAISADGFESIDGQYTETAEALFTEVNTARVQFYTARLAESDRLLEGKQYAEALEQLTLARSAMTDLVEANLFKMSKRIRSASAHAIMMEGALLTDRGRYREAKKKFKEATWVADGQPVEGLAENIGLASAGQCSTLPTTVTEMYRVFVGEGADERLRSRVNNWGCPESMLAPADTISRQQELLDLGIELYPRAADRKRAYNNLYAGYLLAPTEFAYARIRDGTSERVAAAVKENTK